MAGFRAGWLAVWLVLAPVAQAADVVVFGDSISAAYGLDVDKGWVAKLQQKLANAKPKAREVVNASVSGETTQGGLSRLPAVLAQHKPSVLVLELGGNDGLRGQPVPLMEQNLRAMIALARKSGAKVLLVGIRIPPNYGKGYTDAFAAVYPRIARDEHVPLVPFLLDGVAGNPALMQQDGIHPAANGQDRLMDNVWGKLKPLL